MSKTLFEKLAEYVALIAMILMIMAGPVGCAGAALTIPALVNIAGCMLFASMYVMILAVFIGSINN